MILVLSGHARVGKDTFSELLKKNFKDNYFTMAYADELKFRCAKDFELSKEQLWGDLKEVVDKRYPKKDGGYWTPREILQYMGTEAYRTIDNDYWVKQLFKYVDRNKLDNVIITDGRFPNEIKAVKERGGIHIRINRDGAQAAQGQTHASETSLDDGPDVDFYISNNGSISDLEIEAKKIIKEIEDAEK